MKEKELSDKIKELQRLREKYRFHQTNIDIIKDSFWDIYEHIDKDAFERQKKEDIKWERQMLRWIEDDIRKVKKDIRLLNQEQNKRNNQKSTRYGTPSLES